MENAHAERYVADLRNQPISVSTHNRKIKRLAKIFRTLEDYREGKNPFQSPALQRKEREEQSLTTGRRSFSREQEEALLTTLDDPKLKLLNKNEIRMIYLLGMFTGQRLKDCVMLRWRQAGVQTYQPVQCCPVHSEFGRHQFSRTVRIGENVTQQYLEFVDVFVTLGINISPHQSHT